MDFKEKLRAILLSLPKSFYLKSKSIDVDLSETAPTSYFNPTNFKIVVAINNVELAIQNAGRPLTDDELEFVLRGQLYHEISHAILTPPDLMQIASKSNVINPQLANIIEDERIETMLKNYYLLVDFKKQLKLLVDFIPQPQSFTHFVFNAVRFRYSPIEPAIVKQLVNEFLRDSCNQYIDIKTRPYHLVCLMERLVNGLEAVWTAYVQKQQQQQQQNQGDSNGNSSSDENNSNECNSCSKSEELENDEGTDSSRRQTQRDCNEKNEQEGDKNDAKTGSSSTSETGKEDNDAANNDSTAEEVKHSSADELPELDENELNDNSCSLKQEDAEKLFKRALLNDSILANRRYGTGINNRFFESRLSDRAKLLVAIAKNNGFGCKPKAPSSFGTCGRFSSRGYIKDITNEKPSFKWFVRKVNDSHEKNGKTNVKILNIWLDNSGSYDKNDDETNKILKALCEIEKQRSDFKFTLTTFNYEFVEKTGDCRTSSSDGSTNLAGLTNRYKAKNPTGKEYNIFLIDGRAHNMDEMRCLNNNKCVLIVDMAEVYDKARLLCPHAKKIVPVADGTYPQKLAENVIKAVEALF